MTDEQKRQSALENIERNIARHGHHIYVVAGTETPRFAYTIGLSKICGVELVLAGTIFYLYDDVEKIINGISERLKLQGSWNDELIEIDSLGSFTLRKVHESWSTSLLLGAFDFYQTNKIPALQIVPDSTHWTIDVPNMSEQWSRISAPIWRWLHEPWIYPIPSTAHASTNLKALQGERITEAVRWEEDYWELFAGAGPDVTQDETRVVSLGTLMSADPSLDPIMKLPIGQGLWRDTTSEWHPWIKRITND